MTSDEPEAFATRLPVAKAERLWEVVEETGLSRSDILARAVSHYLDENPDDLPALRSDRPVTDPLDVVVVEDVGEVGGNGDGSLATGPFFKVVPSAGLWTSCNCSSVRSISSTSTPFRAAQAINASLLLSMPRSVADSAFAPASTDSVP